MSIDIVSRISSFLASIPFWGWILAAGFILFCFAAIMGTRDTKKIGRRACKIIKGMDTHYNDFIMTKMNNTIIEKDSIVMNKEELLTSALTVLKPEIQSLISLINSTPYTNVEIRCDSQFFNNIVTLCQELFMASRKSESKTLSAGEEARLYSGIKDAVLSDLTKRIEQL
ncbi:MAG: hypothetical protein JXB88_02150 [Spirochaetales bacterium]|nr:hypothetical protein [Spirochaetales bacterium]